MYEWFRRKGNFVFGSSHPREPKYLGPEPDQPFPANPLFRSEAVLSEAMRDLIYSMVIEQGKPMKVVSEKLNVDVRRVGAVIRLKQVEKQWIKDVSFSFASLLLRFFLHDESIQIFRLVLKTKSHGYTLVIFLNPQQSHPRFTPLTFLKHMELTHPFPFPQGKSLATPYAKAVMQMLPQTTYDAGADNNKPHEAINEIPVHKYSVQQLFVPVAESRHFTREDAAKAFHERLLSPDQRSPHRQLVEMERDLAAAGEGLRGGEKLSKAPAARKARAEAKEKFEAAARAEEETIARRVALQTAQEEAALQSVRSDRFEFRVREINADDVGRHGRSSRGVGWRYGAPLQDRKRGLIKIPTSVG